LWTRHIKITCEQIHAIQQRRKVHTWSSGEKVLLQKRLKPYQYKKHHTKRSLIKEIQIFYNTFGRIPLKQEFNSRRIFRTYFGSWNSAIIAAGFKPHPVYFSARVTAHDGHICDSTAERIIDDWLSEQNIKRQRNKYYSGSKMTADFYLPEGFVA